VNGVDSRYSSMRDSSLSLTGTIVLVLIGLLGIAFCLALVGRRKLTMSYAIVWVLLIVGMELLVGFPPLLRLAMRILGASEALGALRLLALVTIVAFLIFFSVKVSVLTNRLEELVQRLALVDYNVRNQISSRHDESSVASSGGGQDPKALPLPDGHS
jgi:hypothetical protein